MACLWNGCAKACAVVCRAVRLPDSERFAAVEKPGPEAMFYTEANRIKTRLSKNLMRGCRVLVP